MFIARVTTCNTVKNAFGKKFRYLCKNIFTLVHEILFSGIRYFKSTPSKKLLIYKFYKDFKEHILIYSGY